MEKQTVAPTGLAPSPAQAVAAFSTSGHIRELCLDDAVDAQFDDLDGAD